MSSRKLFKTQPLNGNTKRKIRNLKQNWGNSLRKYNIPQKNRQRSSKMPLDEFEPAVFDELLNQSF